MSGRVFKFDDSAHRAANEMLPWLVNGTLEGTDLAAVEQHVRDCPRCRREIDLLKLLQQDCMLAEPVADATSSYNRLRARITTQRRLISVSDSLDELLGAWRRTPALARWAIAAEFAVIAVLAVAAILPLSGSTDSIGLFRTLGAPPAATAAGGTIAVVFDSTATESELRRIVRSVSARVIDGPTASNAFVLQVAVGNEDSVLSTLRAEPAVVLAEPLTEHPAR